MRGRVGQLQLCDLLLNETVDDGQECRGVEVDDQRLCSATRSLTVPRLVVRCEGLDRADGLAEVTSPSAIARSSARPPAMGTFPANAVPQSDTTSAHRQLLSTLGEVALVSEREGFGAPAIVVVGEVAALADKLAWFEAAKTAAR